MAYGDRNQRVLVELEALIEKIGFGTLDLSFDLNNKAIRASTFYGKKRFKYQRDNQQALKDIAERLVKAITEKKTEEISFVVKIRNGDIENSMWQSKFVKSYEDNAIRNNQTVQEHDK